MKAPNISAWCPVLPPVMVDRHNAWAALDFSLFWAKENFVVVEVNLCLECSDKSRWHGLVLLFRRLSVCSIL